MIFKRISDNRLVLLVTLCCACSIFVLFRFAPVVSSRSAALEYDLNQHFLKHQLLQLDATTLSQQVRKTGRLSLAGSDFRFDLELEPNDLRTPGYRAEEFGGNGVGHPISVGPVRTFKGRARGRQAAKLLADRSEARFTIDETVVEGLIITPTEHYFVEPARKFSKSALSSDYVIYKESDVVMGVTGDCGVTLSEQVNKKAGAVRLENAQTVSTAVATALFLQLQIATEADFEYVQSKGGSPAAAAREILSIMNQVEGLYETQLGLTIKITYQSAWNTPSQPYTSTNPSTLLSELANYWNGNRGSVARDVVHMWTAKDLDNATIGTAYLEALCRFTGNGRAAYGFSKGVAGLQQIAITAHEIGHNLGASHPNQQVPPPAGCDNTVMSSNVSTTPQLDFCPYSANEIANYLATSIDCLRREPTHLSFAVPKSLPVGPMSDAAVGDFNNDGKQDLVAEDFEEITVLLGSDSGDLIATFKYPFVSSPVVGDFDSDGKQDLVVRNGSDATVKVLRGDGTGGFKPAGDYGAGGFPSRLVVSDFNVDGKQDLAALSGSNVNVLFGDGLGGFQAPVSYSAELSANELFVGEFTSDNAPDLIVARTGSRTDGFVNFLRNTGNGQFELAIRHVAGSSIGLRVAVGDMNGDGISDVITLFPDSPGDPDGRGVLRILLGNGAGGFRDSLQVAEINSADTDSAVIGDFNGDSNPDLAVAGGFLGAGIEIRYGNGTDFLPEPVIYNVPGFGQLATGDFNGDGNQDLIEPSVSSVALGSSGGLQAPRKRLHAFPAAVAAADFNRDGKQDLVVLNTSDPFFVLDPVTPSAQVLLGTGAGDFGSAIIVAQFERVGPNDVTVGDFDGDGMTDIALAAPFSPSNDGKDLKVILANNSGFNAAQGYATGSTPLALTTGDFNGDSKLDLVVAGSHGEILLLPGGGDGVFNALVAVATVNTSPSDLAAGDLNSDGILDLAVAYEPSGVFGEPNMVSVLLGASNGGFLSRVNLTVEPESRTVTVGDFNFDRKLDLAVDGTSVFLGKGDGTFTAPIRFGGGGNAGLAAADFNGDNKTDIAAAATNLTALTPTNNGSISVLLNISGNSFTAPVNDNFADSRIISGPNGTLAGTTILATKEIGELNHAIDSQDAGGASIWYQWKAPFTGRFYFQTFSSSFPSVIAVYTGTSVNTVTPITKSSSAVPEYVELDATAGTTYRIAIDGVNGDTGRTVLTWNTGSLSNDNFNFARELRGISGSIIGNNSNFTLEPNEPTLPGADNAAFSAWYSWTAPNTGKVSFTATPLPPTPCGDTTRLLGAYTGNFIDTLSSVAFNFDGYRDFDDPGACDNRTLRFNAIAGTTYRIQLRSVSGGPFNLAWSYANPPPNDNFANALVLAGPSGSLTGSNKDATKEPGELNHAGGPGGASIWYRWTAPASGPATFDTIGFRNQTTNSFRYLTALLAVYTGSDLNALTAVTTNATDNKVVFNATAGTTYHIAIDSAPYAGGGYLPGLVPLHWGTKQVANDDFTNAQPLTASDTFVPILGSNAGATKETGEPNHAGSIGGASVWYRWTALSTGNVDFVLNPCIRCTLSTSNARVGVYTGVSVNVLTSMLVTGDNNHTFAAVRGTTYFFAVDSNTGTGGTYEFSLVSANVSARNDAFANAQVLSGSAGAVAGDNSAATSEAQEPNHANDIGGASVWYQWKAPASGLFTFDTFGSNFDTLLAVYTGNAVNALTVVASSDNAKSSPQSRLAFDAKVDTTYYIAVDGKSNGVDQGTGRPRSQAGFILLNWNNLPAPANDNFASAQVITGASGNVTGRNTVAGKEGGEPDHAAHPGGVSVWYQWTAPTSGNFTFNTFSSDFNTLLGIYSGSELTTLSPVSANDDAGASAQSRLTLNAAAGTVYYIAIDGSPGVPGSVTAFSGNVVLSWFPETGITNDSFSLAQQLSGNAGTLAATNAGASKENGEPNHANDRGGRSVWYSWTATSSGPVLFTTSGSDFDTVLAIYSGSTINGLTLVASNDDSSHSDNLTHILTSSLTFTAIAGSTYKIAVDGSGGRFGNFSLRWGPDAKITGHVSFIGGKCGNDKKVTMILSGEDARNVTLNGSGTYSFEHLRVGGNYSVRGVSEISASCLPLFLERAHNSLPLAGDVLDANFVDDGLRGGGSTSNITGRVRNAVAVGLNNVAIALSGSASRTVYTDSAGLYQLPNLPAGSYQVTPSKAGAVFSPPSMEFNFPVGQSITDADFTAQESFNISGQTKAQNGAGLAGVTVTLSNGIQPVSVQTDSNGYYSFDAMAGGSYTLTARQTGLGFNPTSKTINGLNANQKNVDFTITQPHTLTITSINPASGVTITVSPIDNNSQGSSATPFSRTYSLNTNVGLTAPLTTGGNVFQKWLRDGTDYSTDLSTSVTIDGNHTLTAVYVTTTVQTPVGQNLIVQLNGVTVQFANVSAVGTTTITPINPSAAGQLPNGYQLTGSSIAFDISTTAMVQPPISVCFSVPSIADPAFFSQFRILHSENGSLVDRTSSQDFATKTICATVNSLSPFVLVTTTVQQLQLLLEESATPTTQAAALDAVLFLRDPFPVVNTANLLTAQDHNTRILLFVKNVQLGPGETAGVIMVHLVGANGQSYDVPAENLFSLPGFDFSQVTFRLPDTLVPGICTIEVRVHEHVSNLGTIRIRM
jgi:hypothetical protein